MAWDSGGGREQSQAFAQVHTLLSSAKVSSADASLEGSSMLSVLPVLVLQPLL